MSDAALELTGASKHFGGVHALSDVDFRVEPGEVHGLLGENGSGKSTLVKIVGGYHTPEPGARLSLWGEAVDLPVIDPNDRGIAIIHQDLALVDEMTVLENLGITTGYGTRILSRIDFRSLRATAASLIDRFGIDFDIDGMVGRLDPADRAALAIVRALLQLQHGDSEHGVLIMDEPTAYLSGAEAERVGAVIRSVAASGSSVVFISHHLGEVLDVADRLTILRDGRVVERCSTEGMTERLVITAMLGRELGDFYPPKLDREPGDTVLETREVTGEVLDGVSFDVRAGEVLGVTGLVGMGQQELPFLLSGATAPRAGSVRMLGDPLGSTPRHSIRQGVALVPANRQRDGVWLDATASENISLPVLRRYFRRGRLERSPELAASGDLMETFVVKPPVPTRRVASFSGGNQQKIVLAKWMQTDPALLLLDEPTQGVDAGARREILELVVEHAARGAGVVVFSTDLEQLAHVCNRVLVLVRGRIVAELDGGAVTEDALLHSCHAA